LPQPFPMHAVTGAVNVAAGNPLMGLHQIEVMVPQHTAGRFGKAPFPSDPASVRRIAGNDPDLVGAAPLPRQDGKLDASFAQRLRCRGAEALATTVGTVLLANDRNFQAVHQRIQCSTAFNTRSTGICQRRSLTLPPPQPSLPQGRQEKGSVRTVY